MSKFMIACISVLVLTSCGQTKYIENKYDDSEIKAYQVIQDARINAIQASMDAASTQFDNVLIDFNSKLNNLEAQNNTATDNLMLLNTALTKLQSQVITITKICNSGEYLIHSGMSFYAVYMVSNAFGTYLGKLGEDVNYQTTDHSMTQFKISNHSITCL